ncbi:MAG: DUF3488 and transglutaminase-like domain-containing protein [Nocardioides sp.]|uniref:DUF3488 and transglutaminase-like domain-containing protein n=1 Tax=Nocardioides sp. TaxID=35761 RepID=UPI003F062F27
MSRTSTRTRVRPHLLAPQRNTLVDLAFVLLLGTVAISGLGASFSGQGYLVVGVVGLAVAAAVVHLCRAVGWPLVAPAVLLLAFFFLAGGPLTLRSLGNTAFLPTSGTVRSLAEQAIFGWKDFLTTLPPVDGDGPLLVLPLLLGLVGGMLGTAAALARVRRPALSVALPVVAMTVLMVGVILLGVRHPSSLLLQGGAFAALSLGWLALRARRFGAVVHGGSRGWGRLAVGTALVLVAAGLALPASALFGDDDADRAVARNWVEPPFEIGRYPSPLAGFRRYVDLKGQERADNVHDEVLFTVDGAPAGTRFRFAAMDQYDGMVWGASDDPLPGEGGDSFQRVSSTIDNPAEGEEISATVTVGEGYHGVWLPTAGSLQSMEFRFGDPASKRDSFRYNLATSTAVVPSGINPGDTYSFTAVQPDDTLEASMVSGLGASDPQGTSFLDAPVAQWTEGATTDVQRLLAAAKHLRTEGKYSDGVVKAERHYHAGHGLYRLDQEFVGQKTMVGNDEQYAAVMALLAQKLGIPARVVMGAVLPEGGEVRGKDVQAWIEVRAADGTWKTLPTEEFMSDEPPTQQTPETEEPMSGTVVPPPNPIPPPSDLGDLTDAELKQRRLDETDEDEDGAGFTLPAWVGTVAKVVGIPVGLILLVVGSILGLKLLRRRRRRSARTASGRFVGAWSELVDHARDLGHPVPLGATVTRREQARGIGAGDALALARHADSSVFGRTAPEVASATEYWTRIDATRREMSQTVPWHRRALAALNLTTLRPGRRTGPSAPDGAAPGRLARLAATAAGVRGGRRR